MARGWARLKVAAAVSAASTSSAENAQKLAMVEAYAIDLQHQVQHIVGGRGGGTWDTYCTVATRPAKLTCGQSAQNSTPT